MNLALNRIEVIKDAPARAMFGEAGKNGVVQIAVELRKARPLAKHALTTIAVKIVKNTMSGNP